VYIADVIVLSLSLFFVFATFVSLLRWDYWWVRIFDYPRLQIGVLLIVLLGAGILVYDFEKTWHFLIIGAIVVSIFYQARKVYRYTIFAPKQVISYKGDESVNTFSLIVSNVYQPNRKAEKLISQVNELNPDLLLVLETNSWWENELKEIEKDYPYTIKKPLDNLYGMILYSRLRLKDEKINFLFDDEIPSFEAWVMLNKIDKFKIYCLHPKPPFPTESKTSTDRDAELLIVGKEVLKTDVPVLIFGDFNDVAWSNTTRLFQKVSRLLDPRIGRGFYNTFHAGYPLFRWSLDHVFHSDHFQLFQLKRLKGIGSDHFPIYVKLHFKPEEKEKQEEPEADEDEYQLADEKIEKAEGS
jgi:endonuclease/exonuclease/phosphatase (EEP) superfamily protein YafD